MRQFDPLRERYADSIPCKRDEIARAWDALAAAPDDEASLRDVHSRVHRLAGSASAYGFVELAGAAAAVDRMLGQRVRLLPAAREPASEFTTQLQGCMKVLLDCLGHLAADRHRQRPAKPRGELRVVVVDDDPPQAALLAGQLETRGCRVRVGDGADALWQALVAWPCDAVVLDYWLRGGTAAELAAAIRRESMFARTALVCRTGDTSTAVHRLVLAAGCDAVLGKDEPIERVIGTLRDCVARRATA